MKTIVQPAEINKTNQKSRLNFERMLLSFSAVGTILIVAWILKFSNYGIDFTDEGFYLVWIANPFLYDVSLTQFGFVYHPLYLMLGGDIASLRQANVMITFGLSWCLTFVMLRSLATEVVGHKATLHVAAAGLATASLIIFDYWLPTPSYNSLAFQALLVASIGLILSEKDRSPRSILGWVLVGIGGWLAFMAKPSTALALAIGVLIYLVIARKFSVRRLSLAIACALGLLLASAFWIDGSITGFVDRLREGIQFGSYLDGGHTLESIIRLDTFLLDVREKWFILALTVTAFIAMYLVYSERISARVLVILISMLFLGVTASLVLGLILHTAGLGQFQEMIIWGIVIPMAVLGFISGPHRMYSRIPAAQWGIAILFLVMPYIYSFGTNDNYWKWGPKAAIFWLLGGLVLLSPLIRARRDFFVVIPLVLAIQAVTAILLQTGLEFPYRQPQALRLNDTSTEIGTAGSNLVLSAEYAKYLEDAKSVAARAGLVPGTPMIDLTGQSPGILYALRAESIGQAWTIGGYPGSLKRASAALSHVQCTTIAAAWILFEPDGPREIPTELLNMHGADFPRNYQLMGSWLTAKGAGGFGISRKQSLYAPMEHQAILNACLAKRN